MVGFFLLCLSWEFPDGGHWVLPVLFLSFISSRIFIKLCFSRLFQNFVVGSTSSIIDNHSVMETACDELGRHRNILVGFFFFCFFFYIFFPLLFLSVFQGNSPPVAIGSFLCYFCHLDLHGSLFNFSFPTSFRTLWLGLQVELLTIIASWKQRVMN